MQGSKSINLSKAESNLNLAGFLKSMLVAGLVVLAVTGAAILLAWAWLKPPGKELWELFTYLLLSGLISVSLGLGWMALSQRNLNLRVQLATAYLVGAVIALVNIAVTATLKIGRASCRERV